MRKTPRGAKFAALLSVGAFVFAACGSDSNDTTTEDTAAAETTVATEDTEAATEDTEAATDDTAAAEGGGEAAMTVTYTFADTAVWNDGSPVTWEDVKCTWEASVNTPESISTVGYDQVVDVSGEGNTAVVSFGVPYAPWKTLFTNILQASQHEDCNDVSADFDGAYTYGANPYMMTSWTPEQIVFEANPGYVGPNTPKSPKVVVVPAEDGATLLKSGAVDFVFPQGYTGLAEELADPNVEFKAEGGGQYEGLYFNQDPNCEPDETRSCAFVDPIFREAMYKSIDLEGIYQQIYAPFAGGLPLLECGPVAPGPYCDPVFTDTYDPEGAATLLTDNGWTQNAEGMWTSPDGEVPEIHFMVSSPNPRREGTQEYIIPKLAELGFKVMPDNCEALPCVFEVRLPAIKYDLTMYINTVAPDPVYLTSSFVCDQIPSEENEFQGQNNVGWCNEEVSDMLHEADRTLDEAARTQMIKDSIKALTVDHVMLPLLQFPNVGAFRTDKVAGTQSNLANYWSFKDWWNFEDVDGDGQVVIGAEQFPTPDCTNPITACANSSWFVWVAAFPQFPSLYASTNEQTFVPGELLVGEAEVEVL